MKKTQENILKKLIESSRKINSNIFNLNRIIILALIAYIRDGLQYRELKTILNVSDGKLQSNLNLLEDMGYIKKEKVNIDKKKITI